MKGRGKYDSNYLVIVYRLFLLLFRRQTKTEINKLDKKDNNHYITAHHTQQL